jgi:hypothetical protein
LRVIRRGGGHDGDEGGHMAVANRCLISAIVNAAAGLT